jgi:tetratricopeptide (TPR) repeat protein
MINEPETDGSTPSIKLAVIVFFSIGLMMGCCGLLVIGIRVANMQTRTPVLAQPSEDQFPLVTREAEPTPVRTPLATAEALTAMNTAMNLTDQGEYAQAIPLWDEVIFAFPENGQFRYKRALCYYNLLPQEHDIQQYETYSRNALADMDKAISLSPGTGDYYAFRHEIIINFTGIEEYRVNRQAITRIAQENAKAAITLGYTDEYPFTERVYAANLIALDQCDQALVEIERMLENTAPDEVSITGLYTMRAEALACLGRYEEAVQDVDASLQNPNNPIAKAYRKALYLYQLGELEQALDVLNETIAVKPTFQGYRYYLRALIYYDLGEKEMVNADLETGSSYTWERMGLYAYVLGKMALDDGRQSEGIEMLQMAEASLDSDYLLIRSRILDELAQLGTEPLSITPSISITSTPIPDQP